MTFWIILALIVYLVIAIFWGSFAYQENDFSWWVSALIGLTWPIQLVILLVAFGS